MVLRGYYQTIAAANGIGQGPTTKAAIMELKNDEISQKIVTVLLEAVAKEAKPGVFEIRLALSTLREFLDEMTPERYSAAVRSFNAIDPEIRKRIQKLALRIAKEKYEGDFYEDVGRGDVKNVADNLYNSKVSEAKSSEAKGQATGLLGALNFRGRRQKL